MSIPILDYPIQEKLVTVADVSWEEFKGIEVQQKDNPNVRLSYLSRILEIMSPIGDKHEYVKTTLGYLLEAYMRELGIRFYGRGGYGSGTPDESYCIGSNKETRDIVTSGTINRKELYKPKKVPEVWFWKSNQIKTFRLNPADEYGEVHRSGFFPNLDPTLLLQYIGHPDQYDAVALYRLSEKSVNSAVALAC
ncbi:Uma2 family endonuclease [Nostoc sp. NMS8]|uniref:Uma2 family endonuclease n=1 Tax=Nostoc sp. NMS8 TaxID=2815392 RepID=UPI0025EE50FF|nr:Uma2 family endonuclease [Nostoc sp. NMS8]MBN3961363.1 Uma2 family endonuclease [Nostoc sp. NMS8]